MDFFGTSHALGGTLRDRLLLLVGIAGVAFCLSLIFLAMRAVLDVGGACADGGPYIPRVSCPSGVPLAMVGGIFGLFLFGGITGWFGSRIGGRYGALVLLAWPALFISLGWNFLEYGFKPPGEQGWAWGWLFCGVVFMLMGAGPLLAALPGRPGRAAASSIYPIPNTPRARVSAPPASRGARRAALLQQLGTSMRAEAEGRAGAEDWTESEGRAADDAGDPRGTDLVSRLERLAALRDRGAITEMEFGTAKRTLINDAERQP